jgi:hypothetical protein
MEIVAEADEFNLGKAFYDAYRQYDKLLKDSGDATPAQEDLDKLLTELKAIAWRVDQLRLFSPNEELEEINTADLKFLLVPFMLGETQAATQDMMKRLPALRSALVFWRTFAQHCERLGVAHADDLKALCRPPDEQLNPNAKRDEKIERYKRSKELDQKARWLFKKRKMVAGDEYSWGHSAFDEDLERDLLMALLGRGLAMTVDQVGSAESELPMLEMMMARGGPGAPPPAKPPPPAEKPWCVRLQDKSELQNFYLQQVFQPDIPMPTMTLAECAEIEMKQAREAQEKKVEQERRQHYEDADRWWSGDRYGSKEDYEDEEKTYKDRSWDDWKDAHPYGSGNKMHNCS